MHGKQYYLELVKKVSKINKGAARYMRKRAPKEVSSFAYYGELNGCFIWCDTPQGHDFWEDIWRRLEQP